MSTPFLTVQQVAARMQCEHRTVRRAINSGQLEAAMIGGRWLIREEAVEAWFDARRTTRASHPQRASVRPRRPSTDTNRTASVARLQAMERNGEVR